MKKKINLNIKPSLDWICLLTEISSAVSSREDTKVNHQFNGRKGTAVSSDCSYLKLITAKEHK
jgi:hypothetical protein